MINLVFLKLLSKRSNISRILLLGSKYPLFLNKLGGDVEIYFVKNLEELLTYINQHSYDVIFTGYDFVSENFKSIEATIKQITINQPNATLLFYLSRARNHATCTYLRRLLTNLQIPNDYSIKNSFSKINDIFKSNLLEYYVLDHDCSRLTSPCNNSAFWLLYNNSSLINKMKHGITQFLGKILKLKNDHWINNKIVVITPPSNDETFEYIRKTGRVVTIQHRNGHGKLTRIQRISGINGGAERESIILSTLHESSLSEYVIPPESSFLKYGLIIVEYPFIPGKNIRRNQKRQIQSSVLHFLEKAAQEINPYELALEPAFNRFTRYISQIENRITLSQKNQLIDDLNILHNNQVFRMLCHGEFRTGNMYFAKKSHQIKILDWPQAYIGHPLIDWWMFLYWEKAPKLISEANIPSNLLFGISKNDQVKLWSLWKALYHR